MEDIALEMELDHAAVCELAEQFLRVRAVVVHTGPNSGLQETRETLRSLDSSSDTPVEVTVRAAGWRGY